MKDTRIPLPIHPTTGLTALGIGKRGPIWPVLGGNGEGDGGTGEGDNKGGDPKIKGGDGKAGEEGKDGDGKAGDTPPPAPADVTKTKEYRAEKKRADDLEAALEAERDKNRTEDEKATAATIKSKVTEAVSAKETELTDHYETIVGRLQDQIVDSTIDAALSKVGRDRKEFSAVLDALDKRRFLDDDGAVKTDAVSKWASELAGSSSSKPPRTSSTRSGSSDRGFGRYLNNN